MIRSYLKNILDKYHVQKYATLNLIEVSRKNLIHNFQLFKQLSPGNQVIAVLKSNAYGHGLQQVAKILNDTDCSMIAVDGYFEANGILGITKHKILVMGYVLPDNIHLLDNDKCSYVLQTPQSLHEFGQSKRNFKVHLEINTGMNRLGIDSSEIDEYLDTLNQYPNLTLEGVMSHLADADNPNFAYTAKQVKLFDQAVTHIQDRGFSPQYIHIAQSAGSAKVKSQYANTVRVGIGLYGINPLSNKDKNYTKLSSLKPILEFKSTIIKILQLEAGARISYNGIYTADKPRTIAVLPLGYYEGIPREVSNKGIFKAGRFDLPIRGRVCMNHTMIDITDTNLKLKDQVIVISSKPNDPNSIQSMTQKYGLFSYSLLTNLSESVRRVVV